MASDLLSIGASGARAARGALDVTAQNIANAASEGYVRRSVRMEEVSAAGGQLRTGDLSLSGVRIAGITRNADLFRQAEVRRTTSDLSRSATELKGLENIEAAIEQAGMFAAITEFEASLQQLAVDPTDPSLRAAVIAGAQTMAQKFTIADSSTASAAEGMRFEAQAATDLANVIGGELARVNLRLSRAGAGSSDRASLLDRRDTLLEQLSGIADIATSFAADGGVSVRLGGSGGPLFVAGGTAGTLAMTSAADGTVAFDLDGTALTLSGGSLAGAALALDQAALMRGRLDAIADGIAATVNAAQASGAALDGSPGQPLFAGTGAAGLRVAFTDGAGLATAAAGQPAGSRDAANLAAMRQALATEAPASSTNALLFDISALVQSRTLTHEAIDTIAASARITLEQQAGVDLDTEATNLIRFQQAFQASARAMQVSSELFDTLLGIG